jgi:hypothetical protein
MLLAVVIGLATMAAASWRRTLFISMVPLYYLLFQSFVHTEFRYTLPMQYFAFLFAGVGWVLTVAGISRLIKGGVRKISASVER